MTDYSRFSTLKIEKQDKVALVTFNKPESMNTFSEDLKDDVEAVLEAVRWDPEVNAIVLTGEGKAFSAGGNIKRMKARLEAGEMPDMRKSYNLINVILNVEKPIIAAVNGHAIGLGATVALFCDVVFASETARLADPHVNVGLVAGDGGAVIWPLLVGVGRAKQYLMTGDAIEAKEAERIGLVHKVLPAEEVVPAAMAFARRLANGPIQAISWTKIAINQSLKQQMNLVLPLSLGLEFLSIHSADHFEAVSAFADKRTPSFTGK